MASPVVQGQIEKMTQKSFVVLTALKVMEVPIWQRQTSQSTSTIKKERGGILKANATLMTGFLPLDVLHGICSHQHLPSLIRRSPAGSPLDLPARTSACM